MSTVVPFPSEDPLARLRPEHLDHLRGSGLSDATIIEARIRSVHEGQTRALGYARGLTGIAFPYPDTEIRVDGRVIRRDGRFVLPELEGLNPENLVGE